MRFRPRVIFSLLIVIFFAVLLYEAREWRLQARLYPWAIGIPMLVLALIQFFAELKGGAQKKTSDLSPVDFQFSQVTDGALGRHRTVNIFSWIFGFFIGIWLLGFSLAVMAMMFLYLKFQSGEKWWLSFLLTAVGWLFFWGLFDWLLRLPFPEGQLVNWLGLS